MTVGLLGLLRIVEERVRGPLDDLGRDEALAEIALMTRTCEGADRLVSAAYHTLGANEAIEIENLAQVIDENYRRIHEGSAPNLVIESGARPWFDAKNLAVLLEFCFAHTADDTNVRVQDVGDQMHITIYPLTKTPRGTLFALMQELAVLNSATLTLKPEHKAETIVMTLSRGVA